jgi:hypothetical protein
MDHKGLLIPIFKIFLLFLVATIVCATFYGFKIGLLMGLSTMYFISVMLVSFQIYMMIKDRKLSYLNHYSYVSIAFSVAYIIFINFVSAYDATRIIQYYFLLALPLLPIVYLAMDLQLSLVKKFFK